MNRDEAQALADGMPRLDPASAFKAGMELLRGDYPDILLPAAKRLADRHRSDPRLAQLHGLAARAMGEGPAAYAAFTRAARLAPNDPLIAHSHARTALDAGKPAVALFERACAMAPQDGSVLPGLAAAMVAEGRAGEAIARLTGILNGNPSWIEGHRTLAHIAGQMGEDPLGRIDAALAALPASVVLHHLRLAILLEARRLGDLPAAIAAANAALGSAEWLARIEAHAASERGDCARADRIFAALPAPQQASDIAMAARHSLRAARPADAASLLEAHLGGAHDRLYWPYLSLAWRMLDDPRHDWLEGDAGLVGVYDLGDRLGDTGKLADHLRALHFASEAPLDQSVRGGTQTDGNLLLRDEEPIRKLRTALLETVASHVAKLAPEREGHPTLVANRAPLRVAGSWSVRLKGAGFHTDHVHPHGWFSSAFYAALPETGGDAQGAQAGWLSLGESRDLVPGLASLRLVEPRAGRLVLFPSIMWHGTRPFTAGERLTAAFDIALPSQS